MDEDRALMTDWFNFFEEGYPKSQKDSMIWADTLLRSTEPHFLDALGEIPSKLNAFILALSLRTRAPLRTQLLRFELEETSEERLLPHSGYRPIETMHLPGWPGQQQLGRSELAAVPEAYVAVWEIVQQPIEHGMRRCLGAYRAAIGSGGFVDAVPVLSCAALEALAGTHKSGKVIQRVARYSAAADASSRLKAFYRLRQWFAHGADIPEMRDPAIRMSTVEDGLSLVKEVILATLQDPDLIAAASAGVMAVKAHLEP